jgi:hypothetical protein
LNADGVVESIGDSSCRRDRAVLPDRFALKGAGSIGIVDEYGVVLGDVHDVGQFVFAQICRDDLSLLIHQLFQEGKAQSLDHRAVDLSLVADRMNNGSDIVSAHDL